MGKTTLTIQDFEQKKTQKGVDYWLFETSIGKASVWDAKLADTLKKECGNECVVELTEKDNFKNIRAYYPPRKDDEIIVDKMIVVDKDRHIRAGVAMRFAVDLCIAGKIELDETKTVARNILEEMRNLAE